MYSIKKPTKHALPITMTQSREIRFSIRFLQMHHHNAVLLIYFVEVGGNENRTKQHPHSCKPLIYISIPLSYTSFLLRKITNFLRWDLPPLRAMCFLVSDAWLRRSEAIYGLEAQRHRWKLLSGWSAGALLFPLLIFLHKEHRPIRAQVNHSVVGSFLFSSGLRIIVESGSIGLLCVFWGRST